MFSYDFGEIFKHIFFNKTPSVTDSENTENREKLAFYFESKIYLVFHTISHKND